MFANQLSRLDRDIPCNHGDEALRPPDASTLPAGRDSVRRHSTPLAEARTACC